MIPQLPQLSTVLAALGIQPGEGLATGLLFGQFVFLGVTLFTLYTAATAIFLSHFDAAVLPVVFVVSAICLILGGLYFHRLERTVPLQRLLPGVMMALILLLLILRVGLALDGGGVVPFLLLVAFRISWTLANLVAWALAGRLFNVRQSKRLFPLIMAGSVVGIITTGLVNSRLIGWLGAENLLFVAIAGFAGATTLLIVTLQRFRHNLTQPPTTPQTAQAQSWLQTLTIYRNRYILWIFGFSIVSTVVTYLLEFIFVSAAGTRYASTEEYAAFFGTYLSMATFCLLLVSLLGGPLLNRFGLKFGVLANSGAVTSLALLLLAARLIFGPLPILFWLVLLTKLSDDVLAVSLNSASIRILLQPIPATRRVSVQTVLESIAVPASIGMVGLLLILMHYAGDLATDQSILLMVLLSLIWLFASIKVYHAYRLALRHALDKRRFAATNTVSIVGIGGALGIGGVGSGALYPKKMTAAQSRLFQSLQRTDATAASAADEHIDQAITQLLTQAGWLVAARQEIINGNGEPLLIDALTDELVQLRTLLFALLTQLTDRDLLLQVQWILERAASAQAGRDPRLGEQRAYAQEVLETLLPTPHKAAQHALLTEDLRQGNLQAIARVAPPPHQEYGQWLQTLCNASDAQLTPWTRLCATYAADHATHPDVRRNPTMLSTRELSSAALSTIEKVTHLNAVSIFAQLPDRLLANIAEVIDTVDYLPGQLIFQKGDWGDAMYMVVRGRVQIVDEGLELEQLGVGGVFGELALLDNEPRSASVSATEATLLLRLPQAEFHELLDNYPEIARGIIAVLSQRLRARTHDLNAPR